MDSTTRKILEIVTDMQETMATKDDIRDLQEQIMDIRSTMATKDDVADIRAELADIKARLTSLEATVGDHALHSKEIDHAFERIAAIEKHLGIQHVAAQ